MNSLFRFWALFLALLLSGCGLVRVTHAPVVVTSPNQEQAAPATIGDDGSRAFYYYGLANLLASDNDLPGAVTALRQAREYDPHSSYLDLALAEVYLRLGDKEQGTAAVKDALQNDPDSVEAHTLLGRLYLAGENYPAAIEQLQAACALAPDDGDLLLELVVALVRNKEADSAVAILKTFIAAHPQSVDSVLALARLYQETGQDALAEETYRQIVKDHPELREARLDLGRFYESRPGKLDQALEIYRQLLAEDSGDIRLRNHLAAVLITAGQLDAAKSELQALLDADPGNLEARRKLGLIAIEQERWQEASRIFGGLLAERPDLDQARYYLGIALERQGDSAGAIAAFAAIPAKSPFADDALIHRAYLLQAQQHPQEAIDLLASRLAQPAERADLYLFLSSLYLAGNQDQKAMATVVDGLQHLPTSLQLHYQHGVLLERVGQHDEAAAEMEQVLKEDPEHAEALNYLAYRWAERKENLQQALRYARRAVKKSDQPYIRDTLGWVLYQLGDFKAAVEELQKAAKGLPDDPVVREHLADACQAAGLDDLAVKYYRELLEKDHNNKVLLEKLDKSLKQLKN